MTKLFILAIVGGSVLVLDQISKAYIDHAFSLHESLPIIPDLFSITYVRNKGAAFGLFAGRSSLFRAFFFSGVSLLAFSFLALMVYQVPKDDKWQTTALSLLLGGAIGNIVDRVRMSEVIDFLDFYIGAYHWPAFNVADSAITIGVTLLMLHLYLDKKNAAHQ
ncbi:MAG: signal peptidase II [Nitrospirae bacterium]|nr:signal peptidase II [Candidatus Troglogloeales bacterium]MBI3598692.1 signal peptidase II [Candidatus Troglogloeales bacterium]